MHCVQICVLWREYHVRQPSNYTGKTGRLSVSVGVYHVRCRLLRRHGQHLALSHAGIQIRRPYFSDPLFHLCLHHQSIRDDGGVLAGPLGRLRPCRLIRQGHGGRRQIQTGRRAARPRAGLCVPVPRHWLLRHYGLGLLLHQNGAYRRAGRHGTGYERHRRHLWRGSAGSRHAGRSHQNDLCHRRC